LRYIDLSKFIIWNEPFRRNLSSQIRELRILEGIRVSRTITLEARWSLSKELATGLAADPHG
jgi:hypothetical protein